PDGTPALALGPASSRTVTCRVGRPRESSTSIALRLAIRKVIEVPLPSTLLFDARSRDRPQGHLIEQMERAALPVQPDDRPCGEAHVPKRRPLGPGKAGDDEADRDLVGDRGNAPARVR